MLNSGEMETESSSISVSLADKSPNLEIAWREEIAYYLSPANLRLDAQPGFEAEIIKLHVTLPN